MTSPPLVLNLPQNAQPPRPQTPAPQSEGDNMVHGPWSMERAPPDTPPPHPEDFFRYQPGRITERVGSPEPSPDEPTNSPGS